MTSRPTTMTYIGDRPVGLIDFDTAGPVFAAEWLLCASNAATTEVSAPLAARGSH